MAYKTDYSRVQGLGSAKDGVHHWWLHRVSSVALIPLTILFIIPFGRTLGEGYAGLEATYGSFGNAIVAILFIATTMWHFSQGIQVVIEDYVHGKTMRTTLLLGTKLLSAVLGASGVLAVATILFGA